MGSSSGNAHQLQERPGLDPRLRAILQEIEKEAIIPLKTPGSSLAVPRRNERAGRVSPPRASVPLGRWHQGNH
jgi:hypothetical protein